MKKFTLDSFTRYSLLFIATFFTYHVVQADSESTRIPNSGVVAEEATAVEAGPQGSEVEVVSANGSVTRAKCPHTCADRKIPKSSCKEWRSKMYPDVCYVEDTSKPSNAIPLGK